MYSRNLIHTLSQHSYLYLTRDMMEWRGNWNSCLVMLNQHLSNYNVCFMLFNVNKTLNTVIPVRQHDQTSIWRFKVVNQLRVSPWS